MDLFEIKLITEDSVQQAAHYYADQGLSDEMIAMGVAASVGTNVLSAYGLRLGQDFKVDGGYQVHSFSGKSLNIQSSSVYAKTRDWASKQIVSWFVEHRPDSAFLHDIAEKGQRARAELAYQAAKAAGQLLVDDGGEAFRMELPDGIGTVAVTRQPDGRFQYNARDLQRVLKIGGAE